QGRLAARAGGAHAPRQRPAGAPGLAGWLPAPWSPWTESGPGPLSCPPWPAANRRAALVDAPAPSHHAGHPDRATLASTQQAAGTLVPRLNGSPTWPPLPAVPSVGAP